MKPACTIAGQLVEVSKGITTKREKVDGIELLISRLKFRKLELSREQVDNLIGRAEGWTQSAFFDLEGSPTMRAVLTLPERTLSLSGSISGAGHDVAERDERQQEFQDLGSKPEEFRYKLTLLQALLYDIVVEFRPLGAHVSGAIAWKSAGDEVENVEDLLGRLCLANWSLHDSGQFTLLDGDKAAAPPNSPNSDPSAAAEEDELYAAAASHVMRTGKVSVVIVQKALKCGYNRAARIVEAMEARGIVGPLQVTGARDVLVTSNRGSH